MEIEYKKTPATKPSKKRKEMGSGSSVTTDTSPPPSKAGWKALNPILKRIKLTDSKEKTEKKPRKKSTEPKKERKKSSDKKEKKEVTVKKKRSSYFKKQRYEAKKTIKELEKEYPEEAAESRRLGGGASKIQSSDTAREIKIEEAVSGIPYWLDPKNIRDKQKRRPGDPGYDPTTLWIPKFEYMQLPSVHKKYWKFKSKYFDKMVAVKMWSFYFFYGMDAIIIHKLFDTKLNELKGRVYTQFHEASLPKFAPKLLENGHKIVVVEKVKKNQKKDDDRTKKGVVQVLTRGTYTENEEIGYSSQFCLCVIEYNLKFGLVYFDTTTHEFFAGEFQDDIYRANLRTLVTKIKPVEIVYFPQFIQKETLHMLKAFPTQPTMSEVSTKDGKVPTVSDIIKRIMKYFSKTGSATKPALPKLFAGIQESLKDKIKDNDESSQAMDILSQGGSQNSQSVVSSMKDASLTHFFTLQAIMLCLTHLENVLLAETVFVMGSFYALDLELEKRSTLYLDSQALENLEILDIGYLSTITGDYSLFGFMDKTVSPFGKRMFRRWVTSPLFNAASINERLDAVEDLVKHPEIVEYFHDKLKGFPDLERIVNRTYTVVNKKKPLANNFEEFAKNRLGDYINLLTQLEKVEPIIEKLAEDLAYSKSKRLRHLTKIKDINMKAFEQKQLDYKVHTSSNEGMFPKISHLISDLKSMMRERNGVLLPAPGLNEDCDNVITQIDDVKSMLQDILNEQKRYFKCENLKYVHTKQRYEIEIPEDVLEKRPKPSEFVITSKKKGFVRLHTPDIEEAIKVLDKHELELTKALIVFVVEYFKKFYERKAYWNQVILCLAELDCLCGLAKLASQMPKRARPLVHPAGGKSIFELKDMIHPCAALREKNFIANDLVVENAANLFLITGPNMGGKSTFLRQACIAVIMAQAGSFVPASHFEFSAIDRIFTRVGASDRLVEGKSTFFIEMEETYHILKESTNNSMLVIDELGRGTSTYDGVSIAYAVLKHIAQKLKCVTLFATHYHLLIEEFRLYKNVVTYCMESEFNPIKDEIKFKYKFKKGYSASSHGLMIAKMAGLPASVLQVAKSQAVVMTKEKKSVNSERELTSKFNDIIEGLALANFVEETDEVNALWSQLGRV